MKQLFAILISVACAFSASAEIALVFGFDTSDTSTYINGISYNDSKQSITFSGAVSATTNVFTVIDGESSQVNFLVSDVDDIDFSGTITPSGGSFNVGGNGAGVDGGTSAAYFDSGEAWTFTFSHDVTLTGARYWGPDDGGQAVLTNGVAVSGSPYDDDFSGESIVLKAGEALTFMQAGTGTHALQDFNITVVPEPATLTLIGIGGLLALVSRRIHAIRNG